MKRKLLSMLIGIMAAILLLFIGHRHDLIFAAGVDVLVLFVYLFFSMIVLNTDKSIQKLFCLILAFSIIPLSISTIVYFAGDQEINTWIAIRSFEILSFISAVLFINKKVKKYIIPSIYIVVTAGFLYFLPQIVSLELISFIPFEVIIASLVIFAILVLRTKRKFFKNQIYIWLMIFLTLKLIGDPLYLIFNMHEGYVFVFSNVVRTFSIYYLYLALVRSNLNDLGSGVYNELTKINDYYRQVYKSIKIGIIILSFTNEKDTVMFHEINNYARRYLKLDVKYRPNEKVKLAELSPLLATTARQAKNALREKRRHTGIHKVKTKEKERYIKTNYYSHYGDMTLIVFEDITDELEREKKVKDLIQNDSLTKLYNRNYIIEVSRKLNNNTLYPISIVIGDVNGLKATNDIFGHFEGDRLLREVANILLNSVEENDVCLRYGGDEFLLVLFNCDKKRTVDVIGMIKKRLQQSKALDFTPSISFGYSIMNKQEDLDKHIRTADQMMYAKKSEDEMNIRKGILESLLRTLKFKNIESKEHLINVEKISIMIGKEMELSKKELEELTLISSLHDIGKINIALDILQKEGKLSDDEWEIVKKHSLDGYSMTDAIKEFKGISKYILFHHEQWDGKGYPYGLRGESIPTLSRIVSVADAFDSMTRARSFRKPISKEDAIKELLINKGKQFDPDIVEKFLRISDLL